MIRREAYRRIKVTFDMARIQLAYPTVTIHAAGSTSLPDGALEAAARMALRTPANDAPMPA